MLSTVMNTFFDGWSTDENQNNLEGLSLLEDYLEDELKSPVDPMIFLSKYFVVGPFDYLDKPVIPIRDFLSIVTQATEILKDEPTLHRVSGDCSVVGSIGGRFDDLVKNFNIRRCQVPDEKFIFLGKYIDEFTDIRKTANPLVLYFLFSLKIAYPEQTILLRGASERFLYQKIEGKNFLEDSLLKTYGEGDGKYIFFAILQAFSYLPLACVVNEKILCVGGGVSPRLTSLEDIENIQRPIFDITENQLALDLTSARPIFPVFELDRGTAVFTRGKATDPCEFSEQAAVNKCAALGVGTFFRSGRVNPSHMDGIEWFPRQSFCSLASTQDKTLGYFKQGAIIKITKTRMSAVFFTGKPMPSRNSLMTSTSSARSPTSPLDHDDFTIQNRKNRQ